MAVLDIFFEAESMARTVDVKAVVPNDLRSENKAGNPAYDRAMKTLILLHGFGGHGFIRALPRGWRLNII